MSPSYRIVFYVSGHGFGHTSRTIEVIHAVLRARPEAHIVVKTSAPHRLFERTLAGTTASSSSWQCDAGMIQIDSLNDRHRREHPAAVEFQTRVPSLVAAEAAYLRDSGAQVVVGDIPPLAFAAADAAGIPVGRDRQFHVGLDLRRVSRRGRSRARARLSGGCIRRRPSRSDCRWPADSKGSNR